MNRGYRRVRRPLAALLLVVTLLVFRRALAGMGWLVLVWAAIWFLAYIPPRLGPARAQVRPNRLPIIVAILLCTALLSIFLIRLITG